jgi:hypothetical protein
VRKFRLSDQWINKLLGELADMGQPLCENSKELAIPDQDAEKGVAKPITATARCFWMRRAITKLQLLERRKEVNLLISEQELAAKAETRMAAKIAKK